jgi:probable LLM family oxidoreductase
MEIGMYTFVEATPDPVTGKRIDPVQRMRDLMDEIELADQLGLEVFGIGEHHREEYLISTPAVVLAAAAVKTKNIRLTSAVTVLSSDDPVRVFQDFATVDLLSNGRAEIMAGRGSFIESFRLFGFDLDDYDELFEEKLELLLELRDHELINWSGKFRPSIKNLRVFPRPVQQPLPVWIAVGGTPQSVIRAATLGLPMALAIIGGTPDRFVPLIELYRNTAAKKNKDGAQKKVSINSHCFLADTSQEAADIFYPSYAQVMSKIGRERGWSGVNREQFELMRSERGALLVGSPQEVIDKILYEYELFHHDRFLAQLSVGTIPHQQMMHAIELLGSKVAPVVRKETGNTDSASAKEE